MRGYHRFGIGPRRSRFTGYDKPVECPESGGTVEFCECLGCEQYQVWRKGDAPRCRHEFEELKSEGYYKPGQEGWMEYLKNAAPDTYERLKEEEESRKDFEEWWKEEEEKLESMQEDMRLEEESLEPDVEEEKPWYEQNDADEVDVLGDFAEEEEEDNEDEEEEDDEED